MAAAHDVRPAPRVEGMPRPPSVEYRMIHGYRRAFRRAGSGPALLLIHGIGDSSESWMPIFHELARDHTVIAPDLLGHGASDKPRGDYSIGGYANAMRDLLSVLGVERVTVVGHSLGGGVAMQLAYQYPERCERLVLVCTGGVGPDVNPMLRLAAVPPMDAFLPLLRLSVSRRVGQGLAFALKRLDTDLGRDTDDLMRVFDIFHDQTSRKAFVRTLRAVVDFEGQVVTMLDRSYLAKELPSLIVWGARDAIIPSDHGRMAHEALPQSRLEILADAGHFPHRSHPHSFVRILRNFLETTEPASYTRAHYSELLRAGRPK